MKLLIKTMALPFIIVLYWIMPSKKMKEVNKEVKSLMKEMNK